MAARNESDRFGILDIALIDGLPKRAGTLRKHLHVGREVEFELVPWSHARFEVVIADHVLSLGYAPPVRVSQKPEPEEWPTVLRRSGLK